jgi:DNA-binding transcriptional ArsR family regulator
MALVRICASIDASGMDEIDILQAGIMRTLAHPLRLEMIHRLAARPLEVGKLAIELGISQPNASQHLAVMRSAGVVTAERSGREVAYRLSDPEIVAACNLMRGVLARRLDRLALLSSTKPAATTPRRSIATATGMATERSHGTVRALHEQR